MSEPDADINDLLQRSLQGDRAAGVQLSELLYVDLRRVAERQFSSEASGHTLQATALIHESYLRLVGQNRTKWQNRDHFLAVATSMMRRVLTDHARSRLRLKRGGQQRRTPLQPEQQISLDQPEDVVMIHDALEKLEQLDPRQARIVELRFFGGMNNSEVAEALGLSLRTVEGEWASARAWLRRELSSGE
ncbi:MAG: hypothetical protein B7Z52_02590 [Burkholderiales bacterium 12-64-5]|nr:MAG: hypothetical protein B7Z52_02590 [Burkholderiales bacterium 12-64-5]